MAVQSPDPAVRPYIDANHLTADLDRKSAISLFRWIRRLAAQPALAPWVVSESTPGGEVQTDEQITESFLRYGSTAYHVCGTVRMGNDAEAVLDLLTMVFAATRKRSHCSVAEMWTRDNARASSASPPR